MTVMTSDTHPIRVDFVAADKVPLPGRIGLTFAPGKKQKHGFSGFWDRDLGRDLARLRDHYRTDGLVSLIEEHEFADLGIPDLREQARDYGMESIWFPIPDVSVPSSMECFAGTIDHLCRMLRDGQTVVVHCKGGLGRSGLVAASVLVQAGVLPQEAVSAVRAARLGAIETNGQEAYIEKFHLFISSRQTTKQQE